MRCDDGKNRRCQRYEMRSYSTVGVRWIKYSHSCMRHTRAREKRYGVG